MNAVGRSALGDSRTMELVLTGRMWSAQRSGGCCVGHGQDDEGFQGVDSDIII